MNGGRRGPMEQDTRTFSSPALNKLFEVYKFEIRKVYAKKFQGLDEKCFRQNSDNVDAYAKCLYAVAEDAEMIRKDITNKIHFVQMKIEECVDSPIYKSNTKEGDEYCGQKARKYMNKAIESFD